MSPSRTDYSRRIDWSGVKGDAPTQMRIQVVRFVRGIRGPRQTDVTQSDILRWFSGTPAEFVREGIVAAISAGELLCERRALGRRRNGRYVYSVPESS
jgi:hypothetical protein